MAHSSLFASLDDYLRTALEVLATWGQWLAEQERLVLEANVPALEGHAESAHSLHADLQSLQQRRARLLEDAAAAGYKLCEPQATGPGLAAVVGRLRVSRSRTVRRTQHAQLAAPEYRCLAAGQSMH